MSIWQPPPTYAEVTIKDKVTKKTSFNPLWLQWFLSLWASAQSMQVLPVLTINNSQGGVPVGIPSSGSIVAGVLTLNTAFATIYSNGIYLFFPAGAVGTPGFYWVVMSSTTVGAVYTDQWSTGTPVIPASPTGAAGAGAYVTVINSPQSVLAQTILSKTLGNNGYLRIQHNISAPTSAIAGNRIFAITLGGTTINTSTYAGSASLASSRHALMYNRGNAFAQVCCGWVGTANILFVSETYTSIDTTSNQALKINFSVSSAALYMVLESFSVLIQKT